MVVQKAINNLKERPKEERTTVAGGIAIAVMIVLFIGWGFLFLRKIQREGPSYDFGPTQMKDFNWGSLKDAGGQIKDTIYNREDELRNFRGTGSSDTITPRTQPSESGVFGTPAEAVVEESID